MNNFNVQQFIIITNNEYFIFLFIFSVIILRTNLTFLLKRMKV